jgi:hypothetical protein
MTTLSPAECAANIQKGFLHDQALVRRILQASVDSQHKLLPLFNDIAQYILVQQQSKPTEPAAAAALATTSIPTKKRKLEGDSSLPLGNPNPASSAQIQDRTTTFECDGVSVSVPARKKLKLEFSTSASSSQQGEIRLLNPTDSAVEYTLPTASIDQAFCLPVPEKQARQWNFCIFPQPNALGADGATPLEQLVFTINEPKAGAEVSDVVNTETQLNALLAPYNRSVARPSDAEFASSIPQSHRKGETAYHVKAHRGSKEGYLFFLAHGVVFGFKKPLLYFPFSAIESVSYTSVLQRTFNLVVAATGVEGAPSGEVKEVEFSMLDQADFAGIDAYIKKHGLNDASMAAQRRAKAYNVNKDNKKVLTSTDANGEGLALAEGEGEEEGEGGADAENAFKTEQELQDEEDELEEDYEASGGESDGEGEDSEEEEDGDDTADGGEDDGDEDDE